jgi:NAD(P)-dependent dehydrogenase (short-subunit alcohol dehydrogenase family)
MRRAVAINLTAVMRGTELAAEMEGVRLVVNVASVAGLGPVGVTPVYAATKAGVVNFTRSLRWLERQRGVRVVAICPSWTATPMVQAGLESGVLRSVIDASPFGIMQPAQVGEAFALALDDGRLAGDVIVVTGDRGVRVMRFKNDGGGEPPAPQPKL